MNDGQNLVQIRSSKASLVILIATSMIWLPIVFYVLKTAPLGAAFFGGVIFGIALSISTILSIMLLIRPNLLLVDMTGITQTAMGRVRHWNWCDVTNFRVTSYSQRRLGPGESFVFFDDRRTGAGVVPTIRAVTFENSLMSGWTMGPRQLAALLNARRAEWAATPEQDPLEGNK